MQVRSIVKPGVLGLCALVLAGCENSGGFGAQNFRVQYDAARTALENGNYDRATRGYARLLPDAGPLQPRIRLEYAHALLRAGTYDKAAEQARFLAQGETGAARGAALAVLGTAEHELGLGAIDRGDQAGAKQHFQAAQTAIDEVLRDHADLDPLGALAGRLASIKVRLKALG